MRVCGLETEYGLIDPADPDANPIAMSAALVDAYRTLVAPHAVPWDYGAEDPLSDARGQRVQRAEAHPDLLTDAPAFVPRRRRGSWEDPSYLNAVLPNGARLYVDHAHPEYSGPEVTSARDLVTWDRAGDAVLLRAAQEVERTTGQRIHLFKNNVDGKGASYGTHENYLCDRSVPFEDLARLLTAHLVTRQVYTGAGRVGKGQRGDQPGFQLSQRADYIEAECGLETTLRRPIVNTRDEPHAAPERWRRLHIIVGDANTMDMPTFLKVGTTDLMLSAIEAADSRLEALVLADPVNAIQAISHDPSLRARVELASGDDATALDTQRACLEIARSYVTTAEHAEVIEHWTRVVDTLARDVRAAAADVEWVAKLELLGRLRAKHATTAPLPWDDARVQAADLWWSRLGDGLSASIAAAGQHRTLVDAGAVEHAVQQAPSSTRARIRGGLIAHAPELVDSAGWATVVVDRDGADLDVILMVDPHVTTHPLLEELLGR